MRMEKAVLARLAFAVSLVQDGKNVPENLNFSGGELKRPAFFGPMSCLFAACWRMSTGKVILPKTGFFQSLADQKPYRSRQSYFGANVYRKQA